MPPPHSLSISLSLSLSVPLSLSLFFINLYLSVCLSPYLSFLSLSLCLFSWYVYLCFSVPPPLYLSLSVSLPLSPSFFFLSPYFIANAFTATTLKVRVIELMRAWNNVLENDELRRIVNLPHHRAGCGGSENLSYTH